MPFEVDQYAPRLTTIAVGLFAHALSGASGPLGLAQGQEQCIREGDLETVRLVIEKAIRRPFD